MITKIIEVTNGEQNSLHQELVAFMSKPPVRAGRIRSTWIRTTYIAVYVRQNRHVVNGVLYLTLDIANLTVAPERRRRGIFSTMLRYLQETCPWDGIYIENVLSEHLYAYLLRLAQQDSRWVKHLDSFAWIRNGPATVS